MDLDDWMADVEMGTDSADDGGPKRFYAARRRRLTKGGLPCNVVV